MKRKRILSFVLMMMLCLAILPAPSARAETTIDTFSVTINAPAAEVSPDWYGPGAL